MKRKDTKKPWKNPDDAPELTPEWFENADLYEGRKLIRRGRGRPAGSGEKVSTTIRFDREVIEAFRKEGKGWQTRINQALKEWLEKRKKRSGSRAA